MVENSNFQIPELTKLQSKGLLNTHKFKWSNVYRKTENKSEKLL